MELTGNLIIKAIDSNICDSYHEIIPNLYLGNKNSACNELLLKKIYLVVNCTHNIPFYSDKTINYRVNVSDDMSFSSNLHIFKYIHTILPFMYKCYINKKPILVHCRAGMQRSATIIVCFLIKYFNFTKEGAINYIKNKRSIVFYPFNNFNKTQDIFSEIHHLNTKNCV